MWDDPSHCCMWDQLPQTAHQLTAFFMALPEGFFKIVLGNLKIQILLSMSKGEEGHNSHVWGLVAAGTASSGAVELLHPSIAPLPQPGTLPQHWCSMQKVSRLKLCLGTLYGSEPRKQSGKEKPSANHPFSTLILHPNHSNSPDHCSMLETHFFCTVWWRREEKVFLPGLPERANKAIIMFLRAWWWWWTLNTERCWSP